MSKSDAYIIASEETCRNGDIIFEEGDSGDWIYLIISGSVELSRTVQGHKYIIQILRSGDIFGELENIGKVKRMTAAIAIGDTTLGIIDREFVDKEYNQLSHQFRNIFMSILLKSI